MLIDGSLMKSGRLFQTVAVSPDIYTRDCEAKSVAPSEDLVLQMTM